MNEAELDVSGLWTGAFSYRGSLATVAFDATLDETQGMIGGAVQELTRARQPRQQVTASLHGRRDVYRVSWIKRYDEPKPRGYENPVIYEGELSGDGLEIRGTWRLPGPTVGTFLMIRARGLEAERARDTEAALGAPR